MRNKAENIGISAWKKMLKAIIDSKKIVAAYFTAIILSLPTQLVWLIITPVNIRFIVLWYMSGRGLTSAINLVICKCLLQDLVSLHSTKRHRTNAENIMRWKSASEKRWDRENTTKKTTLFMIEWCYLTKQALCKDWRYTATIKCPNAMWWRQILQYLTLHLTLWVKTYLRGLPWPPSMAVYKQQSRPRKPKVQPGYQRQRSLC